MREITFLAEILGSPLSILAGSRSTTSVGNRALPASSTTYIKFLRRETFLPNIEPFCLLSVAQPGPPLLFVLFFYFKETFLLRTGAYETTILGEPGTKEMDKKEKGPVLKFDQRLYSSLVAYYDRFSLTFLR